MRKNKKEKRLPGLKEYIKKNKSVFAVYVILRMFVIAAIVMAFVEHRYEHVFVCVLSLVLFLIPAFVEKNFGIKLPSTLEIIILLFIFAAEILGEMQSYYIRFAYWDTMLHTVNGFLCAAVGFALVDILNRNKKTKFTLSPIYLAVVAFCFSMTIGVLWEFFEFSCDMILKTDMQKDTVVNFISSTMLDSTKTNHAVLIDNISKVSVNGNELNINGYLDIGLIDTMKDLFVNFIGAVVFSVIGYFYVKHRGKGKFAEQFIPAVADDENNEKEKN